MKGKILRTAAALSAAAFLIAPVRAAEPSIRAQSAILMDAESGRVLYELDADTRSRIASTTKIMTGLLACETLALDAEYAVPAEAVGIEGSSMYLRAGERVTGRELLYGLMLRSGNDAAVALAILCDGSVERFAARMNARAAKLGMENTHFQNPNGLDEEGHFSTARDLARLARAAMKNPDFREAAGTKNASFGQRALTNHNKLLWSYPGANGVKTGYTRAAGRILVSSAERGGRLLIAVTICDPDDWNDHAKLLDYGFSAFEKHTFLSAGEAVGTVPVVGGTRESVNAVSGGTLSWPLRPEEQTELRVHLPRLTFAPVLPGPAGWAELLVDGEAVRSVPLYYRQTVAPIPEKRFFARLFGG